MTRVQRILLGVIVLGMAIAAGIGYAVGAGPGWPEILLRVAIILGAVWLAAPGFDRIPRRLSVGLAAGIGVLAVWPKLVLRAVLVAAVVTVLWRRRS